MQLFLPEDEPDRSKHARAIATLLAGTVRDGKRRALLIARVNDEPVARSPLTPFLIDAGFAAGALGYQMRALTREGPRAAVEASDEED